MMLQKSFLYADLLLKKNLLLSMLLTVVLLNIFFVEFVCVCVCVCPSLYYIVGTRLIIG